MRNFLYVSLLVLSLAGACFAGWERTYGGSSGDTGYCVRQTSDGGYIIVGYTQSFGVGEKDVYLIKIDSLGNTTWTRTYGGIYDDYCFSVAQTFDGGYIIAGWTKSFGIGIPDFANVYLLRLHSEGDTIWTRTYGGSLHDFANSVAQTSDSGFVVAGGTISFGWQSLYVIRLNSDGDTIWTRSYAEESKGNSIACLFDDEFIVTGFLYGSRYDVFIRRFNLDGDTLWT